MKRTLIVMLVGAVAIVAAVTYKRGEHTQTVKQDMLRILGDVRGSDLEQRYLAGLVELHHAAVFAAVAGGVDHSQVRRDAYLDEMFKRLVADARDNGRFALAMKVERLQRQYAGSDDPRSADDEDDDDLSNPWVCRNCGASARLTAEQVDALAAKTKAFEAERAEDGIAPDREARALLCEACKTVGFTPARDCITCGEPFLLDATTIGAICHKCDLTHWACEAPGCGHGFTLTLHELFKSGKYDDGVRCPKCGKGECRRSHQCHACRGMIPIVGHGDLPDHCPHCKVRVFIPRPGG